MTDPRKPSPRRRKGAAVAVILIVIALIAVIFVGENMSQLKDKAKERQTRQPDGGVQQVSPPPGNG